MIVLDADLGPGVTALVTTRAGGLSRGSYASLDLGLHVGDDPTHVAVNRDRVARRLGAPVTYLNQVHGAHVVVVDAAPAAPGTVSDAVDGDALVSTLPGVGLAVMVADCLPILLADAGAGVVGAAHAGRRGLALGVVPATVEAMRALGARPEAIHAYVGPAICGSCYEVGEVVQAEVVAVVPESISTTSRGTAGLDLAAGAVAQLAQAGVRSVELAGVCTLEDERFFSYRRDGVTGRFAGVVVLRGRDTPHPPD